MNAFDEDLIRALQFDGRAPFSALAKQLGVHRTVVAQRVHELLESDEIRIIAAVPPRALGLPLQVHLMLRIAGPTQPVFEQLLEHGSVVFLTETIGQYQAVVEIWAPDNEEVGRTVRAIRSIDGIVEVQFGLYDRVLRRLRLGEDPELGEIVFDDFDIALLARLQVDGRSTFGELARHTGRSASACRARVLRLLDAQMVRIGAVRGRRVETGAILAGIGIVLVGEQDAQEAVEEMLLDIPTIEFAARTTGRYEMVATIAVRSIAQCTEIIRTVRAHPGVVLADSWVHAALWCERYEWGIERLARLRGA
ncbi:MULTISPECIES: Lrp/AsnC family transcriptional regulator [unclassified Leucobacter]|uniref:Lrp/AsnC family transcriptional regulator n=1 Tax=unclassified Leucobacter TaxID=2621730 RepID=UPI00062268DC|nr:Lrp/AsnC family transcriptional regulator [Leucobacter sp. Ag1]KKI22221.1 hypothetical protein XM48_02525 [Leucobacter sp. Ag1]